MQGQRNQPGPYELVFSLDDPHNSTHAGSFYKEDGPQDETERYLVTALAADGLAHDLIQGAYEHQDVGNVSYPPSDYNKPTRTAAGVATNADRKRKRVFSNRTKTGCLTCRKRKKKCDELHPECNNCIRGGFVCEGYSSRISWQRPTPQARQPPVLLQMGGGTDNGAPTRPQHSTLPDPPQRVYCDSEYSTCPDDRTVSQLSPRYEPEYRHETHTEPALQDPGTDSSTPIAAYSSHSPPVQKAPNPPPTALMHLAPAVTHVAVAHAAFQHILRELSERDKMLQGEYYLPCTPALINDRDQCAASVYRFNQACQNPSLGFSHVDRERLFRDVVALRPTPDPPASASPKTNGTNVESNVRPDGVTPEGSVGAGCVVEAPFHCDYGYNLNIGADVAIGANCRIIDTCNVTIGNGVRLESGVTLMCTTYAIHPKDTRLRLGEALGRGIIIEDEAWISANVTILPGVRVGRQSTVLAGSVVHQDVPPYAIMAKNPAEVVGTNCSEERRKV